MSNNYKVLSVDKNNEYKPPFLSMWNPYSLLMIIPSVMMFVLMLISGPPLLGMLFGLTPPGLAFTILALSSAAISIFAPVIIGLAGTYVNEKEYRARFPDGKHIIQYEKDGKIKTKEIYMDCSDYTNFYYRHGINKLLEKYQAYREQIKSMKESDYNGSQVPFDRIEVKIDKQQVVLSQYCESSKDNMLKTTTITYHNQDKLEQLKQELHTRSLNKIHNSFKPQIDQDLEDNYRKFPNAEKIPPESPKEVKDIDQIFQEIFNQDLKDFKKPTQSPDSHEKTVTKRREIRSSYMII